MKTVNYVDKAVRIAGVCFLILALIAPLGTFVNSLNDSSPRDLTFVLILFGIFSFLIGMIVGYSVGLGFIKKQILKSFNEEIKISTKSKTHIKGEIFIITEGLKLESIFLNDNSFRVESEMDGGVIENKIARERDKYTLMMGEDILKKVEKEQFPENTL